MAGRPLRRNRARLARQNTKIPGQDGVVDLIAEYDVWTRTSGRPGYAERRVIADSFEEANRMAIAAGGEGWVLSGLYDFSEYVGRYGTDVAARVPLLKAYGYKHVMRWLSDAQAEIKKHNLEEAEKLTGRAHSVLRQMLGGH